MCSAKHERFLKLVELAVTNADPEDETALFECLNVFKASSDYGRQVLLNSTDYNCLKNKWVENCDTSELLKVIESKSLAEKLELLELSSEKMATAISLSLEKDEEKKAEFELLKLSKYIGQPAECKDAI